MLYALLSAYAIIGVILGSLAIRQHPLPKATRPLSTIVAWAALWPAMLVAARVLDPPPDMDEPYRLRHFVNYLAAVMGLAALALAISLAFSLPFARVFFTSFGGGAALCAWLLPHWFWNVPKMQDLRLLLGDWLTRAIYFALAAVLIWLGLFTNVQIPPR